jgi:hypothetical protein
MISVAETRQLLLDHGVCGDGPTYLLGYLDRPLIEAIKDCPEDDWLLILAWAMDLMTDAKLIEFFTLLETPRQIEQMGTYEPLRLCRMAYERTWKSDKRALMIGTFWG